MADNGQSPLPLKLQEEDRLRLLLFRERAQRLELQRTLAEAHMALAAQERLEAIRRIQVAYTLTDQDRVDEDTGQIHRNVQDAPRREKTP